MKRKGDLPSQLRFGGTIKDLMDYSVFTNIAVNKINGSTYSIIVLACLIGYSYLGD